MTSRSKAKGNSLERDVCNQLNEAFSCKEFTRTPSSGAIMGLSNAKKKDGLNLHTKQTLGADLICPDWFKFSVECKNYADEPNYSKIIKEDDNTLNRWLGEALFDATTLQLSPLLVFKTTHKGAYVALPKLFDLPESILHYSCYNGFWIIGIDHFLKNVKIINEQNEQKLDSISEWVRTDNRVRFLIDFMLKQKKK